MDGMPSWESKVVQRHATSADGTRIAYEVLGEGERAILLANGLGGRLYAWEPLLVDLFHDYKLLTWDYRGLFDSAPLAPGRQLSIHRHVEDAEAILRAEKIDRAVLVGWSMGVQVSLDLAANVPDLVAGLVLLNGTYGHVLQTGFQPLFAVPFLPKRLHAAIEILRARPEVSRLLAKVARVTEIPTTALMTITAGKHALDVRPLLRRYFDEVLGPSFPNFLRLFQELDAHSVYHLLPEIMQPALIVSGRLDMLTPAFQSFEIARRLPNAEHLALVRASHFALRERPELVVPRIRTFLQTRVTF